MASSAFFFTVPLLTVLDVQIDFFWQIDGNVNTGSDHEVILFSIQSEGNLVENPLKEIPYNLEKAD